jgi:hypothetical protein
MPTTPYDPKDFAALDRIDEQDSETGRFEITIKVDGAARVNRLLSWIVRSHAYDDVTSLAVAVVHEAEAGKSECA